MSNSRVWRDYDAICKEAATRQGLDPMIERLTAEGIKHYVAQTGGFTMVLYAHADDGSIFGMVNDWIIDDESRPWMIGTAVQDEHGNYDDTSGEDLDNYQQLSTDEVVALLRGA